MREGLVGEEVLQLHTFETIIAVFFSLRCKYHTLDQEVDKKRWQHLGGGGVGRSSSLNNHECFATRVCAYCRVWPTYLDWHSRICLP